MHIFIYHVLTWKIANRQYLNIVILQIRMVNCISLKRFELKEMF